MVLELNASDDRGIDVVCVFYSHGTARRDSPAAPNVFPRQLTATSHPHAHTQARANKELRWYTEII